VSVVFLHAHPDDEAIFTGGTIARLADDGQRVVVVFATNGDEDPAGESARTRVIEARAACALLGVARVEFLGFGDSGMDGDQSGGASLWRSDHEREAGRVAALLIEEGAEALVVYDVGGIYGHPDHLAVHRIGRVAAVIAGTPTVYEATVDREYLHFVETHLVGHAVQSLLGMEVRTNAAPLGVPTVEVSVTVDVRSQAAVKRAAMAAHPSQIPPGSETLTMQPETFDGVYGYEWFVRAAGPPGAIDRLGF
jgi:LmbE family N-acetylglucosaminyl deacetylase